MLDAKALAEATALIVREHFQSLVAPLIAENGELKARIDALERRAPEKGEAGKDVDPALIASMVADAVAAIPRPNDGKDADPETIKEIVAEAIAAIPAPKDGKNVDPETVKALVAEAVAALPTPKDGKDADPEAIKAAIAEAVAAIPIPKDGRDADPETVRGLVAEAVAALPAPKDGRDADPGTIKAMVAEAVATLPPAKDGRDADPYAPDAAQIRSVLEPIVREHVAGLPVPKDGVSVTLDEVRPLIDDAVSKAVGALPVPKDGVGLAGALIDRRGNLVVTLTNGETRDLGDVVGKDADMAAIDKAIAEKVAAIPVPKDGKDGRDAFQLEDFEASVLDDGRTIRFAMTAGDVQHAYQLPFPVVIDRGVYRDGQEYKAGDGVTWAGSYWIAQRDCSSKPGVGDDFRLSVKRGRDGKDKV